MTQAFVAPSAETDSTDPAPVLSSASRPRTLTEAVVEAIRVRHLARKTEQAYVHWIRRFVSTTVTERVYAHLGGKQLRAGLNELTALHRGLHRSGRKAA